MGSRGIFSLENIIVDNRQPNRTTDIDLFIDECALNDDDEQKVKIMIILPTDDTRRRRCDVQLVLRNVTVVPDDCQINTNRMVNI